MNSLKFVFVMMGFLISVGASAKGMQECPGFKPFSMSSEFGDDNVPEVVKYFGIELHDLIGRYDNGVDVNTSELKFPFTVSMGFLASIGTPSNPNFKNGKFNSFSYACADGLAVLEFGTTNSERVNFTIDLNQSTASLNMYDSSGTIDPKSPLVGMYIPQVSMARSMGQLEKNKLSNHAAHYLVQRGEQQLSIVNAKSNITEESLKLSLPSEIIVRVAPDGQKLILHANGKDEFFSETPMGALVGNKPSKVLILDLSYYLEAFDPAKSLEYSAMIPYDLSNESYGFKSTPQKMIEELLIDEILRDFTASETYTSSSGKSTLLIDKNGIIRPGKSWFRIQKIEVSASENNVVFITDGDGEYKVILNRSEKTYSTQQIQ